MIRIISTPVFAIHRKKFRIHIDTNPEDLSNKTKYKCELLGCKYDLGKFLS